MSRRSVAVHADGERLPRGSHAERSAATRTALLDATIECLVDLGYAGTSTTEITRRAGVSRGAQVHHFPTKSRLVVAAVERLFERRQVEFDARFAALPPADRTIAAALDLMWEQFKAPSFRAVLELAVASLTDSDLKPVVAHLFVQLDRSVAERFVALFPGTRGTRAGVPQVLFAFCLMEGAALYREVGLGQHAEDMVDILRVLARELDDDARLAGAGSA